MSNPWEQDWGGATTATEAAPWEQSWSDAPAKARPAPPQLEPVPGYLKLAARADSGIRKGGLNLMRMVDAASEFVGLTDAASLVDGGAFKEAVANNLKYYNEREAQLSKQDAALDDNSIGGQLIEGTMRAVTELPAQLTPAGVLARGGNALKIAAGTAGAMGAMSSYGQDKGDGKSDLEAIPYALTSGTITALTTKAFGNTGAEAIFRSGAAQGLKAKVLSLLKDAGMEATEEAADQFQQDLLERATRNPGKSLADSAKDVMMAGTIGGIVGGGVGALTVAGGPRGNSEAKALEAELGLNAPATEAATAEFNAARQAEVQSPKSKVQSSAATVQALTAEQTDAGLNEAPADGTASPVERFIFEQKGRREAEPQKTTTETVVEPKPWEMEYEGGEMPVESSKFEGGTQESRKGVDFAKRPDGTLKTKGEYTPEEWQKYTDSVITTKLNEISAEAKPSQTPVSGIAEDAAPGAISKPGSKVAIKIPGYMDRPPETVSGTLVKLKADPNNEYVAINSGKSWKVVERTTGLRPGETYAKTKAAAIALAEANIAKAGGAERMKQLVDGSAKLNTAETVEAPGQAVAKVQEHVAAVADGSKQMVDGGKAEPVKPAPTPNAQTLAPKRAAKEIKSELVQRLEQAMEQAPKENAKPGPQTFRTRPRKGSRRYGAPETITWAEYQKNPSGWESPSPDTIQRIEAEAKLAARQPHGKTTIEIPGDGTFTIWNTKEALGEVLSQAKKLNTSSGGKGYTEPSRPGFNAAKWAAEAKAGRTLENWADDQLAKDPRSKTRAGLDPQEEVLRLAAVAIKGSYVIARGVRDFASWSAEMIRQLPELAQASVEELQRLYRRSLDIAEGRDPEIGLSVRGMKVKADSSLSDQVRENTEAAYTKRRSADDTAEAKRLMVAAGGPEAAARDILSGLWKPIDFPVQVKATGEVLAGLANLERQATERGDVARANDLADLQVRIAEKSRELATTPAQWLQSFASLYANYSPLAWLREWQGAVTAARKKRIEQATGKPAGETPTELAQDIAGAVAEEIKPDAPQVAEVIRQVFGKPEQMGDGRSEMGGGRPTITAAVERIIGKKGKEGQRIAKKIQDFYEREVNKFKRKHKIPELTPEDQRTVLAEAKAIERLPKDSLQRREAVLRLLDSLHRRKGFEWWELPVAFWYANTLSGPLTHAKNILGNSVNLGMEAGLQALLQPTAVPAIFESLGRSLSVGAREAWSILQTGHDTAARHGDKFELRRNPMELQTGAVDKILLPWKLVGRFLRAEDAVFFNAAQELRAAILARRATGGDTTKLRRAMGWTPEARANAEAQAASEGLTGLNYQRRVNEIIEQGRADTIMNPAREFGYDVTFNNEPYGVLGAFTSAINRGFEAAPVLKPFILPFTRIAANVSNSSLNWTPVGTYRALRAQRKLGFMGRAENSGKLYGREINDPLAVRDLHAKAMIGTAAVIAITAAAMKNVFDDEPEFMVTGSGPANKEARDALRASGWIPYSIKVGDRYYSYADKPPQLALAMIGHYLDAVRYKNLEREDALNRVAYALNGNFQVILQSSWLQGLSSLFNQANRDSVGNAYKGLVAQATRTASGFVVPAMLKQTDQLFDPQKYSANDVQGMIIAQVPWARRTGQPDLNAFGQPVYAPSSKVFWSKVEGDDLIQRLAGMRVFPGVPNQGDLTPEEHYALVKYRGPILREALAAASDEWIGAPRLIAQDVVNRISSAATAEAKRELGLDEANAERREVRKWTTR